MLGLIFSAEGRQSGWHGLPVVDRGVWETLHEHLRRVFRFLLLFDQGLDRNTAYLLGVSLGLAHLGLDRGQYFGAHFECIILFWV